MPLREQSRLVAVYSQRFPKPLSHIRHIIEHLHKVSDDFHDLLEFCNTIKVDFNPLFKTSFVMGEIDFSNYCLIFQPKNFIVATDYGLMNKLCKGAYELYLRYLCATIIICDWDLGRCLKDLQPLENPRNFRSFQILSLCLLCSYADHCTASDWEIALQVLWSSIPDPFVCKDEFIKCFSDMKSQQMPKILKAWHWFCKLVIGPEIKDKGPRSLKHLSRCAIRKQLRACFQLPRGIAKLNIPKSIGKYLSLEGFTSDLTNEYITQWLNLDAPEADLEKIAPMASPKDLNKVKCAIFGRQTRLVNK